jgi:hypothetical protein
MNILELAAIVTVRNHINTVMNDKSVSNKEDFRPLNEVRVKLDKKFVSVLKELDIETCFSNNNSSPVLNISNSLVKKEVKETIPEQPSLPLEDKTSFERTYDKGVPAQDVAKIDNKEDDEAADLALIEESVKAQKEQLKKEGRSNKRISKAKNDTPGQK